MSVEMTGMNAEKLRAVAAWIGARAGRYDAVGIALALALETWADELEVSREEGWGWEDYEAVSDAAKFIWDYFGTVSGLPNGDPVLEEAQRLCVRLNRLAETMRDAERCAVRVVSPKMDDGASLEARGAGRLLEGESEEPDAGVPPERDALGADTPRDAK